MTTVDQGEIPTIRATTTEVPRPSSILDVEPKSGTKRTFLAGTGAVSVHALIFGLSVTLGTGVSRDLSAAPVSGLLEVALPTHVEPEAQILPEEREAHRPADAVPLVPPSTDPAPPPDRESPDAPPSLDDAHPEAPAEGGEALTAEDEMLDLSNTVISGQANRFSGGTTTADVTSRSVVRTANARSGGVRGGTGTSSGKSHRPPVRAENQTRAPRLAGLAEWSCPFPPEADVEQINDASVSLRVQVDPTGRVESVTVSNDPGYGFGRVAQRCAFSKRWDPGLDRRGKPTGATAHIKVRFRR